MSKFTKNFSNAKFSYKTSVWMPVGGAGSIVGYDQTTKTYLLEYTEIFEEAGVPQWQWKHELKTVEYHESKLTKVTSDGYMSSLW